MKQYRTELVAVDALGDGSAGVATEVGDVFESYPIAGQ
jgi:hypothetical protein